MTTFLLDKTAIIKDSLPFTVIRNSKEPDASVDADHVRNIRHGQLIYLVSNRYIKKELTMFINELRSAELTTVSKTVFKTVFVKSGFDTAG